MAHDYNSDLSESKLADPEVWNYPRFRWLVLLSMFLVTIASDIIMISPAPLMGVIAESLNMSLGDATGYIMGIFNLVVAVSCVASGIVCDRWGLMPVLVYCSLALTLPTIALPYFGHDFQGVLMIRIIQATGCGAVLATVSPVAAIWFPRKDRGIVTGIQQMAVSSGIAAGFVIAPALYSETGDWRTAMAWQAVICLPAVVVTLIVAMIPKPAVPVSAGDTYENSHSGKEIFNASTRQPATWIGVFICFCLMWILNAYNDLTPAYLAIEPPLGLGFGPLAAGKMMMLLEIASVVGSLVTAFVMVRIFKGKVRPVISIGFSMFAVFTISIMFPIVHSTAKIIAVCLIMAGFFRAWVIPNALAFVAMHYPPHITGKIVGMWIGLGIFGSSAGVICGAIALRQTGNYHLSFILVSAMSLIGLVFTFFLKKPSAFVQQSQLQAPAAESEFDQKLPAVKIVR